MNGTGAGGGAGSWRKVDPAFTQLPIHSALLPNGLVLGFGGSGNDETNFKNPKVTEVFDPATLQTRRLEQTLDPDLFCCGTAFLPDGQVLAAGGTARYDIKIGEDTALLPFLGLKAAYLFDPSRMEWQRVENMAGGRWYPTLVALHDGRVLACAGLMRWLPWGFRRRFEVYTSGEGWQKLRGASRFMPLYPHLHLLPDGDIYFDGCFNTHYARAYHYVGTPASVLHMKTGRWEDDLAAHHARTQEGASVLLPLRPPKYDAGVLIIGGGRIGSEEGRADCWIVDFSSGRPAWKKARSMEYARYYTYAALLPDGKVFVMGGRERGGHHSQGDGEHAGHSTVMRARDPADPDAILEAEVYDPVADTWTEVASMTLGRNYHSGALLLPDGRIICLGGNLRAKRRENQLAVEIFSPPFVGSSQRPRITAAPPHVRVGERFVVKTSASSPVDEVCLVRPGSTTHCLNTDQRFVEAELLANENGRVEARFPVVEGKPAIAPPGWYLLFVAAAGIPSAGIFVEVKRVTR